MPSPEKSTNRYLQLIEEIFFAKYKKGEPNFTFARSDLEAAAKKLRIKLPKNLGDVIYALRYRIKMPESILMTQPKGKEWIIRGEGRAIYGFHLVTVNRIIPNPNLLAIKIPDATPEIITAYALSDEQALLAKIRCNRILDIFLGITTYSLQNHLRTSVKGIGQIEIDEVYVGVDRNGCQYILPVQAKGGKDHLSVVQTQQDIICCQEKFPNLLCRSISTQFITDDLVAIFELVIDEDQVKVLQEKHYRLVPSTQISSKDLADYKRNAGNG